MLKWACFAERCREAPADGGVGTTGSVEGPAFRRVLLVRRVVGIAHHELSGWPLLSNTHTLAPPPEVASGVLRASVGQV